MSVLQALLPVLAKKGIVPDLRTFCNLAIGCRRPRDGMQLLTDMKVRGPSPSRMPPVLGENPGSSQEVMGEIGPSRIK